MTTLPASAPHATSEARIGYAICGVGRSGSSWFAKVLGSTGVLGLPQDFLNTPYQRRLYGPSYPADRAEQVRRILTDGATSNGVYGLKVFPIYLYNALQRIRWTELLPNLRFVHWRRRDILGQALSRHRALQTLQWRSTQGTRIEPVYNGEEILEGMRWIAIQDARWEVFFARNGVEPLRLVYEDVMSTLQASVDAVARLVGVEGQPRIDPTQVELEIQRDATTEGWRARFLRDYGDLNEIDVL